MLYLIAPKEERLLPYRSLNHPLRHTLPCSQATESDLQRKPDGNAVLYLSTVLYPALLYLPAGQPG
ncbi:hypothetical protein GCM10011323_26070 [Pontibacter amylolyticus]|uniref:RES domain-containing protein n=1 Tax=Pontibacter amylolyticus TaxID=1424080 RepID=A0ABQ1WA11_9BACT|nr:hypothetical protein GCM10011323_26070 [Pontibacter amylolyticus]